MVNPINQIIENINKYKLDSLVERALERIAIKPSEDKPWILLAYLETVYREADNNILKFDATQSVFNNLCQQIFELMDGHAFADFREHNSRKMFHVLAYQQFPFQNQYSTNDIQRQKFLFNEDNENSRMNITFSEKFKLSITQYLNVWNSIITNVNDSNSSNDAESILRVWTIDHSNVQSKLQDFDHGISNNFYRTFISEFFLKFPFLRYKGKIVCLNSSLLLRTLYEFLYLHIIEFPEIKSGFDNRFQAYVDRSLMDAGLTYQIDKNLKIAGKQECDFLVSDFLFTECKAIKLKSLAQVNPSDAVLKNNLKEILKAYQQIISTANRVKTIKEPFGVIITYLPFYFIDGNDIWDAFLKKEMELFLQAESYDLLVKPANLFFIDIRSWDRLIAILKRNNPPKLEDIFSTTKSNNSSSENRKFEFSMHLSIYESKN